MPPAVNRLAAKMTLCAELDDIKWLTGSEAGALLAELAENDGPLHTVVTRLRGKFSAARTHLLVEQAALRRRAAAKFAQAERLFFTRTGLEQATDEWVARYKAGRFTGERAGASPPPSSIVADLCCGIGGDLMAFAQTGTSVGVDRDPIAAHFAAVNSGTTIRDDDVCNFDFEKVTAWHIDPDRRPTGHRTTALEWSEPDLQSIERLLERLPHAAVKLAPGAAPPPAWKQRAELEWISRDRECRQLVAWHGDLAMSPGKRRATVLSTSSDGSLESTRSIVGDANIATPIAPQIDEYVFDMDAAVRAAHLTGALTAQRELQALSAGPSYFTGPRLLNDLALACFRVEEVLPLKTNKLAEHLQQLNIGQLEIKKRGVEIDPEKLRRELKLRGSDSATLLLTTIANRPTAILARRVRPTT
jgi:hypothetical protein